jgi:outer membrane protein
MTPAAWPQSKAAPGTSAPPKIAVINLRAAMTNTSEGRKNIREYQAVFAPRMAELQNMQKQINDDQARLRLGNAALGDDERARVTREYDQLTRVFQRKQQEFQDDSGQAQQDVMDRISRKMMEILRKYLKENGFSVILDSSAQQTAILVWSNDIDITQDIIRLYDQNYPVKVAGAAGQSSPTSQKPATPKPQQQPKQ